MTGEQHAGLLYWQHPLHCKAFIVWTVETMQAISLIQPRRFERVEIDDPGHPGPGEALVRTVRMGVCGTDISGYLGKMPFFGYPRILGHELGVEVLELGDEVTHLQPGDRCSVEPYLNCGQCFACRHEKFNCCETLKVLGVMIDGGLCERIVIRADKLHPSKKLSYDQLALVEMLGIGSHATERAKPETGDHVLIIGAGPIGMSTLEFTRLTGAHITMMDFNEARLEFCRRSYGIEHTLVFPGDGSELEQMKSITQGDMYRVVYDATGSHLSMAGAVNYLTHTGRLIYVGISNDEIPIRHGAMHLREATILSSRNALPADFKRIIQLIEDGTIDTDTWISHRTSMHDVVDEFDSLTRPETGVIKAIIEVGD